MKGKKKVTMSLPLSTKEIKFLDSLSHRCSRNGCKSLSRTHIIHNLIKIAGELGLNNKITDCEDEFVECLLRSLSKFKKIKLAKKQ